MGNLVLSFRGLCLHVNARAGILPDGVRHRIIAIDAARGASSSFGRLPAHHCFLNANPETVNALWNAGVPKFLDGWNLKVGNALGPELAVRIHDLPSLSTYSPGMSLRPNLAKTGAPATDACCFVDIAMGTIEQRQFEDPKISNPGYYTTWTVATDGDPQLIFLSRDGSQITVDVPSTTTGETLATETGGVPGSIVLHNSVLRNSTTTETDSPNDFALYYLAREGGIPPTFSGLLPGQEQREGLTHPAIDMTTSCSNSQFP